MPSKEIPRLSDEGRAEGNRRYGRMSRGSTSEAGKSRASRNVIKTGCQPAVHHLNMEDPALIQARYILRVLDDRPESPAACPFLDENARATLRLDRREAAAWVILDTQLADASTNRRRERERDIKDLSHALPEGTVGSLPADLPEGYGATGPLRSDGISADVMICGTPTPAGTLGPRGANSRNEPNVPGAVGPVGSIVSTVPTLPIHPGPDDWGGRAKTSRWWEFTLDEGGCAGPARREPMGKRSASRVPDVGRWVGREPDGRSSPDQQPSHTTVVGIGPFPRRE
jgi:hypothetical protein